MVRLGGVGEEAGGMRAAMVAAAVAVAVAAVTRGWEGVRKQRKS